jgi:uncharacterized protein YjiS (DUF1127 family)
MEAEMPGHDRLDFEQIDYRTLTQAQWNDLRWDIIRRAERARAQALRAVFGQVWALLRRMALALHDGAATAATRWWRAHAERRRRRRDMAELLGFSDRELKDIGVRRSEVYWVVHHGRDLPRPQAASPPSCRPHSRAAKPVTTPRPRRAAA